MEFFGSAAVWRGLAGFGIVAGDADCATTMMWKAEAVWGAFFGLSRHLCRIRERNWITGRMRMKPGCAGNRSMDSDDDEDTTAKPVDPSLN